MTKIKIGGGCYTLPYIFGFESKEDFVANAICPSRQDRYAYLETVWALAHRSDDFRTKNISNDAEVQATDEPIIPVIVKVKRQATKRKSESKKE